MTKDEAIEKLRIAMPYLLAALKKAESDGIPGFAITASKPGGSGKIVMSLNDGAEFVHDIAIACGLPTELTEKQVMESKALEFLDTHGLRKT